MRKPNSSTKKKLWTVLAIACFSVCAILIILLILLLRGCEKEPLDSDLYKNETTTVQVTEPAFEETTDSDVTRETAAAETTEPLADNPINFEELWAQNEDIVAWITVPGTPIDYPILRHPDEEEYYLRRDYLGNYSVYGCIFIQNLNAADFTDINTVIYGHYTKNQTYFGSLHNFKDPDFFDRNTEIIIYTPGHILTYEIFAAYERDARHLLKSYSLNDVSVRERYFADCLNPQSLVKNVREGVTLGTRERLVTLSTCLANFDANRRYIVQGVLRNDQLTK